MSGKASEGIFYVVRFPTGWKLVPHCFDQGAETNHYDLWESSLAGMVATKWSKTLGTTVPLLTREFELLTYGFPRGRITKSGRRFRVFHGDDILPAMKVSRDAVEEAFGIAGRCFWQFDEHEQCIAHDKEEIRRILGIDEDWNAV